MSETPRKLLSNLLADAAAEHASTRNASKDYHFLSMVAQLAGGLETDLRATQAKLAEAEAERNRVVGPHKGLMQDLEAKLEAAELEIEKCCAAFEEVSAELNKVGMAKEEAESALARAQGDARRYRWIREHWGANAALSAAIWNEELTETLDAAIDAAMSSGGAG